MFINLKYLLFVIYNIYQLIIQFNCQLSSVVVEKIELNPSEPKPGESVKVRCYLRNVDPSKSIKPNILWSYRAINSQTWRIIGDGSLITETFNNRLSGRKESDEIFEIVFRPIQDADIGQLKCELANSEGQKFKAIDLNVFSAPYISFITSDVYTRIGSKVVLECIAEGYPKPIVHWSRLGSLSAVLKTEKFEITSVGREDRGTYRCYVENITPKNRIKQSAEAFVTVTIDFPPTIECDSNIMYQIAGINADAEVSCTIEGYPLNSVRWYFNQASYNIETEIKPSQHYKVETIASADRIKSSLVIRNVNREHFGGYTIKVEGSSQQIVERTIMLEQVVNIEGEVLTSFAVQLKPIIYLIAFIIYFTFK